MRGPGRTSQAPRPYLTKVRVQCRFSTRSPLLRASWKRASTLRPRTSTSGSERASSSPGSERWASRTRPDTAGQGREPARRRRHRNGIREARGDQNMSKLEGMVAIVTGASKGIGAGIARRLAEAGAAVVVNYASSKAGADRVVADITRDGGRAVAVGADMSKEADIRRLFAESREAFGRIDILVNNAGIFEFVPLEAVTPELFHKMFNLNVLGLL